MAHNKSFINRQGRPALKKGEPACLTMYVIKKQFVYMTMHAVEKLQLIIFCRSRRIHIFTEQTKYDAAGIFRSGQ